MKSGQTNIMPAPVGDGLSDRGAAGGNFCEYADGVEDTPEPGHDAVTGLERGTPPTAERTPGPIRPGR